MKKPTRAQQLHNDAIEEFLTCLERIEDPRRAQGRRYSLELVVGTTLLAFICGCDDAEAVALWGNNHESLLTDFFGEMPHGPPTQDVVLRVMGALDKDAFHGFFNEWASMLLRRIGTRPEHIAIDGKSARRSYGRDEEGNKTPMLHMVSAYCSELGWVVAQKETDAKSNEVKAIPKVLEILDLGGVTVTIDAMGCQREVAQSIADKKGTYLLAVKDNQPTLHQDIQAFFEELRSGKERPQDQETLTMRTHHHAEKGHGRIEERTVRVSDNVSYLGDTRKAWKDLSLLVEVESKRTLNGKASMERRYYISNGTDKTAEEVGKLIRRHWSVENNLHWVLDMAFREDESRHWAENCASNMATLRHFAVNLLKREKTAKVGIANKRKLCGFSPDYLKQVIRCA